MGKEFLFECDWKQYPKDPSILVSDSGRVLSFKRGIPIELKPNDNGLGYLRVGVGHGNPIYIHRMVAETYIKNDDKQHKTQVNHIDGNKQNNKVSNLEWCTPSENDKHAFDTGLKKVKGTQIKIKETGEIFESISKCARRVRGIQGNISKCLIGERHTHRGYHYEYVKEDKNE